MSDIVKELLFRASDEAGIGWTPTTIIPVPARLLHHAADRIEQLEAEVKVWVNHTKTAVWSDSEECKMLTEDNDALRIEITRLNMEVDRLTRTNQAKREHRDNLLEAKARDAARIQQLEAALRDLLRLVEEDPEEDDPSPYLFDQVCDRARAALEGNNE